MLVLRHHTLGEKYGPWSKVHIEFSRTVKLRCQTSSRINRGNPEHQIIEMVVVGLEYFPLKSIQRSKVF